MSAPPTTVPLGSSATTSGPSSSAATQQSGLLAFAACMRSHCGRLVGQNAPESFG